MQVCSVLALLSRLSPQSSQAPKRPRRQLWSESIQGRKAGYLAAPSSPSSSPRGFGWLAGGRPEGASVPRDPPDRGGGRCQLLPPLPNPEPLERICLGARHLQLAEARARARRGWGRGGGGARTPTPRGCQTHAGPPRPACISQPTAWRCRLLCKSAEASAFIDKSTEPAPPSLHPSPLSCLSLPQISCPISLLCEQECVLNKWENWKRPLQSTILPNYAFKRLNCSDFGKSGCGIKLKAMVREEGQHDIAKSEDSLD